MRGIAGIHELGVDTTLGYKDRILQVLASDYCRAVYILSALQRCSVRHRKLLLFLVRGVLSTVLVESNPYVYLQVV